MPRIETRYRLKEPKKAMVHFTITANAGELETIRDFLDKHVDVNAPWCVRKLRDQMEAAVNEADRTFFDVDAKQEDDDG